MPGINEFTENILDSLSEGVITVDKNFKINYYNRAAETITGLSRQEAIGKFCKYILNSDACQDRCPIAAVLRRGAPLFDFNAIVSHANGMRIPVKMNASVLTNPEGEPIGGTLTFRDMSAIEYIQEQLVHDSQFHGLVAHSKSMRDIFALIEEISDSPASVLIQGESGTGKEMIANAIQATSSRKTMPYIKVNCAIFPAQLLASELFGHVKGAFTGAMRDRQGRFELANKGTILLDEVAEMTLEMQLHLLRILQEGTFERVGESLTRRVSVRVIASTNKNIQQAITQKEFREDLFYRLNVIPIHVPPLRERKEDIPHLIRHFLRKYSLLYNRTIEDIEDEALDACLNYSWPGNVRELENNIEYAFARTKDEPIIRAGKLPPHLRGKALQPDPQPDDAATTASLSAETRELMNQLQQHHWNRSDTARALGIGRTTLWRRMKTLGLDA